MESLINDYISREFVQDPALLPLVNDTSLPGTGILESLSQLRVMAFLAGPFGITAGEEDLLPQNCRREHHLRLPVRPRAWKTGGRTWVTTGRGGCCAP